MRAVPLSSIPSVAVLLFAFRSCSVAGKTLRLALQYGQEGCPPIQTSRHCVESAHKVEFERGAVVMHCYRMGRKGIRHEKSRRGGERGEGPPTQ